MTRHIAFAIVSAAAIAAAASTAGNAFADDIAVDNTPFVSSKSRDAVRAELMKSGTNEWTMQFNDRRVRTDSDYARGQAKADYAAAREEARAFHGEDSGSAYLAKNRVGVNSRAIMGAPAR
jgi:hypothetical protein